MTHRVNDDFVLSHFIKNQVWIGQHCQPANRGIVGSNADMGILRQKLDNRPDACPDPFDTLR